MGTRSVSLQQNSIQSARRRPPNTSIEVGYNHPSKQQDSIFSENSTIRGIGGIQDSLMMDSVSTGGPPPQPAFNSDSFTQMT